jgi:hypothetical protein
MKRLMQIAIALAALASSGADAATIEMNLKGLVCRRRLRRGDIRYVGNCVAPASSKTAARRSAGAGSSSGSCSGLGAGAGSRSGTSGGLSVSIWHARGRSVSSDAVAKDRHQTPVRIAG